MTFRFLSASRFLMLKQGAQREWRPERAVRHDWYRVIARAVDLPVQDNGAGIALLAGLPRPFIGPVRPGRPALAMSCQSGPGKAPGSSLRAMKDEPPCATISKC